jgi:hypothetical protein
LSARASPGEGCHRRQKQISSIYQATPIGSVFRVKEAPILISGREDIPRYEGWDHCTTLGATNYHNFRSFVHVEYRQQGIWVDQFGTSEWRPRVTHAESIKRRNRALDKA